MVSVISTRNGKINAPTFIYRIAHGKSGGFMQGHINHPSQMINGISIDSGIPADVIKKLNNIPEIEMRASCQGESEERPAFIIFRLPNKDPKKLVNGLNKCKDIKAGYDTGNQGQIRIGITNPDIYYNMSNKARYQEWWNILPGMIKNALRKA